MTLNKTNEVPVYSEEDVKIHMSVQPFNVDCSVCGNPLDVDVAVDADLDLLIKVKPCATCLDIAQYEGYEECKTDNELN